MSPGEKLDVYLHDDLVGALTRLEQGRIEFAYTPDWVAEGPLALSHSLPLRLGPFADAEARPFFAGLLPEGAFLRAVAGSFHISASNPFSVLNAIGGECAGAVSLAPDGAAAPPVGSPSWLDEVGLARLIEELPRRPLHAVDTDDGLRLSLAGAQEKLPVIFEGGAVGITRGAPPSTHIIKLPSEQFDGMVANEDFCLRLARGAGLNAVEATARMASEGDDFLLVVRYDRSDGRRLHQEDVCQAMGVVPEAKYEAEGGPGVAECAGHIRSNCAAPAIDVLAFADALIFNFVIGNHDAHSKNFSLLLEGDRSPRLAPLYDLLCTTAYPDLSRKMAMKVGGEYRPDYVRGRHLDRMAADLGMSPTALRSRAMTLSDRIEHAIPTAIAELPAEFEGHQVIGRIEDCVGVGLQRIRTACAEERDQVG
jgi:serine/threonine-protein kinase HipA